MCRQLVQATAPRVFTQTARNPARSVVIGDPHMVLVPAYGSPFIHNLDDGRRKPQQRESGNHRQRRRGPGSHSKRIARHGRRGRPRHLHTECKQSWAGHILGPQHCRYVAAERDVRLVIRQRMVVLSVRRDS